MNKEDLQCLVGKYLNGYKIVKVEKDPFIKGQINLFTDEWKYEAFNARSLVIFRIREESNTSKYYQELIDKEKYDLQQRIDKTIKYVEENRAGFISPINFLELISILQGKE